MNHSRTMFVGGAGGKDGKGEAKAKAKALPWAC